MNLFEHYLYHRVLIYFRCHVLYDSKYDLENLLIIYLFTKLTAYVFYILEVLSIFIIVHHDYKISVYFLKEWNVTKIHWPLCSGTRV